MNFAKLVEILFKKYPNGNYVDKIGNRINILYDRKENSISINQIKDNSSTGLFFASEKWNNIYSPSRNGRPTAEQFLEDVEDFMSYYIKRDSI